MNRTFFITGLLYVLVQISYGQQDTILISGNFEQVSFEDFVRSVESNTQARFYYKTEWIGELKLDTSGTELRLHEVLEDVLTKNGLNFNIDQHCNVYVYKGTGIKADLPNYEMYANGNIKSGLNQESELTESEKKYIESRKVAELELITVGDIQKTDNSKTCVISGRITDETNGEPLFAATVYVEELKSGTATDIDGDFNLALKPGKYMVVANSISMQEKTFYLQVYSNGSIQIPLKQVLLEINEVTVTAYRQDNVRGMQMGFERLSAKKMKEIPVVLGEKDLLKVAQLLPGVQSAGEGANGLNVRGGTSDQNLFYINRMPIYNTSHLFGFFTAINPDIVSDFALYKSNIPVKFGGRTSSIFDIATRQGNKKKFFAQGGISPVTAHAAVEGPIVKDKASYVLSYRGSYSDWILSRVNDINISNSEASFYDFTGGINTSINDKNSVKIFAYKSFDSFTLSTSNEYDYSNEGGSLKWKHIFSSSLSGDFTGVYSQYSFGHINLSNPSEAYQHDYTLKHKELLADFVYLTSSSHRILFGASSILYKLNRGDLVPYGEESTRIPVYLGNEEGIESAVYISDEFSITPRLTMRIGLRYSFYSFLGPAEVHKYFEDSPLDENSINETIYFEDNEIVKFYHGLEPRIAFNYLLATNSSLKVSYNRTKQYIFMLSNTFAVSPTDQWKLTDYHIAPPLTDQVSLGYYHDFPENGLVTSVEIYKKWTRNIVEYKDGAEFISDMPTEQMLLQGNLNSYGLEFMLKKNRGNFTGWLSYSYARSFMQVASPIETEQINNGEWYPSNFDRPHSINMVSNIRKNRRFSLSAILVYSTGRPITYPVATYDAGKGNYVYLFSERNTYRIPDYFRVDFTINFEGTLFSKKWIHSYWMLNIYNLTGRKNAYSVYFEQRETGIMQGYKLSIFGQPIISLAWNFKFGNYASE